MRSSLPTLLDYVGLPMADTNLAGTSFRAALKDEQASGREQVCVYDEYGSCRMIRTAQWKYVHRDSEHPDELWDLVNDPDERTNLIDDPAQAGRIKELRARMEEWFERYVEPDKDGLAYSVTGAGQVRPVGKKWEDGTDPFDPAVSQPPLGGREP